MVALKEIIPLIVYVDALALGQRLLWRMSLLLARNNQDSVRDKRLPSITISRRLSLLRRRRNWWHRAGLRGLKWLASTITMHVGQSSNRFPCWMFPICSRCCLVLDFSRSSPRESPLSDDMTMEAVGCDNKGQETDWLRVSVQGQVATPSPTDFELGCWILRLC